MRLTGCVSVSVLELATVGLLPTGLPRLVSLNVNTSYPYKKNTLLIVFHIVMDLHLSCAPTVLAIWAEFSVIWAEFAVIWAEFAVIWAEFLSSGLNSLSSGLNMLSSGLNFLSSGLNLLSSGLSLLSSGLNFCHLG